VAFKGGRIAILARLLVPVTAYGRLPTATHPTAVGTARGRVAVVVGVVEAGAAVATWQARNGAAYLQGHLGQALVYIHNTGRLVGIAAYFGTVSSAV